MSLFIGKVIGTKMQKTAKVEVTRLFLHPHVLKYIRKRKNFFAHDEYEECREGDWVVIKGCKPLSDKKHYNVVEILERGYKSANSEPTTLTRQRVVDSSAQAAT